VEPSVREISFSRAGGKRVESRVRQKQASHHEGRSGIRNAQKHSAVKSCGTIYGMKPKKKRGALMDKVSPQKIGQMVLLRVRKQVTP